MNVLAAEWSKEIFFYLACYLFGALWKCFLRHLCHICGKLHVEPATFQSKFLGSNAVKVKLIASQLNNEQEASRCVVYGRN